MHISNYFKLLFKNYISAGKPLVRKFPYFKHRNAIIALSLVKEMLPSKLALGYTN